MSALRRLGDDVFDVLFSGWDEVRTVYDEAKGQLLVQLRVNESRFAQNLRERALERLRQDDESAIRNSVTKLRASGIRHNPARARIRYRIAGRPL